MNIYLKENVFSESSTVKYLHIKYLHIISDLGAKLLYFVVYEKLSTCLIKHMFIFK